MHHKEALAEGGQRVGAIRGCKNRVPTYTSASNSVSVACIRRLCDKTLNPRH